jgi:hypothetical protein
MKAIITHNRHLTSVDIVDHLGNLVARRRFKHVYSCFLFCAYKGCGRVEVV